MAFIAARISVLRGRPPGSAEGINGSSRAHSTSVRSLGNRPPSRQYVFRCFSVHILVHPAAPNRHGESSFRRSDNDHFWVRLLAWEEVMSGTQACSWAVTR